MDRLRTRAQERDHGGVLVLLDRRRRIAVDLCAVSPRSRVHRRPGSRPRGASLEMSARIDHWWSIANDSLSDPFGPMATAGLFQIGLPGAGAALDTYGAIAFAEEAIAGRTGLLGLASAFAARQMAARFF